MKQSNIRGRMIYFMKVEVRYKKGKSMVSGTAEVISMEESALDMQKYDEKAFHAAKSAFFSVKSKSFSENNFWLTKVLRKKELSRSFFYKEELVDGKWTPIRDRQRLIGINGAR